MTIYEYNARLNADRLPILAEGKKYNIDGRRVVDNPAALADIAANVIGLKDAAEEYAWCIATNTKNKIIGLFEVGHGTIDCSIIDVRGMFQKALMLGAAAIALTHNHPSGDCFPSNNDIRVTERVKSAADLLGVRFIDHVIIGGRTYCSLREQGILK